MPPTTPKNIKNLRALAIVSATIQISNIAEVYIAI